MRLPFTSKILDRMVRGNFEEIEKGLGIDFSENSQIKNPPEGTLRLYAEDNGAGKTRLVVRDSAGNTNVVWTQP